jgi:hypothetical protein
MTLRICLYGPTGSGKTTLARQLVKHHGAELIKIAEPLYQLQDSIYGMIGKKIKGRDGELLQFLGHKIEKELPQWLALQFIRKVNCSSCPIIVNDDCRLNSYPVLRNHGFVFIHVQTSTEQREVRRRDDHIAIDPAHSVERGFEGFISDYTLSNDGMLGDTFAKLVSLLFRLRERNCPLPEKEKQITVAVCEIAWPQRIGILSP